MEQVVNFLLDEQTVYFSSILLLNIISSCIGTLKQIYTSKQAGKITYLMVLIDAIVYSLVLKSFSSEGIAAIIAYVIGKLVGAVTHVFVNDPTKGYGIFIENMLAEAEKIK